VVFTVWLSTRRVSGVGAAPPAARTWPRSRAWTASQTPPSRHTRNRVYTVCHGGKSCGRSRHAVPDRSRYQIAFTTSRVSAAGRPPLGVPDFGLGRRGSNAAHWSSVRSVSYGFRVITTVYPNPAPGFKTLS
jgi:hypothetical protein